MGRGQVFPHLDRGFPHGDDVCAAAWNLARRDALTPAQYDSPLAKRPYDLRHAGVSFWLNSREVGPTQAAAWAGHSVDTLLRIYASCIEGQQDAALRGLLNAYDQYDNATGDATTGDDTVAA